MLATLPFPAETEPRPVDNGSEEFVEMGWWPYFKEHTNREGQKFGKDAMERIAARCNERITDSGDYSPLVLQHTREDDPHYHPEYAGLVGPYRLGKVGDKWAVFGRERARESKVAALREHPRRSVEYWADPDDPTGGYFDPISALPAAVTPELDLGIHYAKHRGEGETMMRYHKVSLCEGGPMKYEAAFPGGGSNTFAPGGKGGKSEKDSGDDDTDDKKTRNGGDEKKLASYQSGTGEFAQMVEALRPIMEQMVEQAVAKLIPAPQVLQPPPGEQVPPGGGNPADKIDPDSDPENDTEIDADDDSSEDSPVDSKTSKESDMATDAKPANPPAASADDADDATLSPEKKVAKYQKQRDDERTRYQKLLAEHRTVTEERDSLKTEAEAGRATARKASRYQRLAKIQQGDGKMAYNFDPEVETEETMDLSDAQFEKHLERVHKYQRVATSMLPVPQAIQVGNKTHEKQAQYSKRAVAIVTEGRAAGKEIEYAAALKMAEAEDTGVVPAAA